MNKLITKYPKIFADYEGNPGRVNWSCPEGWMEIVDDMCHSIQSHIDHINKWHEKDPITNPDSVHQLTCMQIKEKFGGLRFYTNGGDDYCKGIISFVENMSYNICESCGSNQNIGYTKGWISTVCSECKTKYKYEWEPKRKNND